LTRTRFGWLDAEDARLLDDQGYLLLRGAIPAAWIGPLRDAFEAGALPSEKWPVPRGADWRHSLLELDATVQQVCRLPIMLAAVYQILRQPFFVAQQLFSLWRSGIKSRSIASLVFASNPLGEAGSWLIGAL
jgi:hypothetical protein